MKIHRRPSLSIRSIIHCEAVERRILLASISGTVYDDLNGNGIHDGSDTPQAGVTVFLDANDNGKFDTVQQNFASLDTNQLLPVNGTILSPVTVAKAGSTVSDVNVTLTINTLQQSALTVSLVSPAGTTAQLFSGVGGSGSNFTNTTFDDEAATPISQGSGSFTGSFQPAQPLSAFDGEAADGQWELRITNTTVGGNATLVHWSLGFTSGEVSTTTDSNGQYTLSGLTQGTYNVGEVPPSGFTASLGTTTDMTTSLDAFTVRTGVNFFNTVGGKITGKVYNDTNDNGLADSGETGLGGKVVYLDLNNDGRRDGNEAAVRTSSSGSYTFNNVAPGTYAVREETPDGYRVRPASKSAIVTSSHATSGVNFFDTIKVRISGTVYNDRNGDGKFDSGDLALSGVRVFLDNNSNGVFDAGERSAVTNSAGFYQFTDLSARTVRVKQIFPAGYTPTAPSNSVVVVKSSAGEIVTDTNFGDRPVASIAGVVFTDTNQNGIIDNGENPIEDVEVFIDRNHNGVFNSGVDNLSTTDVDGNYSFGSLAAGTYTVIVIPPNGDTVSSGSLGTQSVTVGYGTHAMGRNFGLI